MSVIKRKVAISIGVLIMAGFLTSCDKPPSNSQYNAEIKVTSYGIPHIKADDFGSLGFGEGYMAARDHVCNIAYSMVEARGERAKFFGVDDNTEKNAKTSDKAGDHSGNSSREKNNHLISDIIIRALGIPENAQGDFAAQSEENQEWVAGFADGYNKYIRENDITSWCKGAKWVRELSAIDLFSRFQVVAQTTPHMAGIIVAAAPPNEDPQEESSAQENHQTFAMLKDSLGKRPMGSNGWAFGRDRTENGRGLLLGNPHFPWSGTDRFWEKHLTIPGKFDIYGAQIIGATGVGMGFNKDVGWTHTVSASKRVTFYKLDLVPGDPTSYYYDGEPRKMTAKKINIAVKGKDGVETISEHTVWFSHYGPMASLPGARWTKETALTLRDANLGNQNLLDQWKDMAVAGDMDEFKTAFKKWNAIPWVNTMATGKDGRAVYIDGSNVGRLSEEAIALWRERKESDPQTKTFYKKMGIILLDGSDSRFEWQFHPEARVPGVVPYVEQPQQDRTDYIFNANDSYWLTNLEAPLRGYSPLYGSEDTDRRIRTRINAMMVSDVSPDGPTGADGKLSLKEMQQLIFTNRSLSAELLLEDLVAACTAKTSVMVVDKEIDLTEACAALKGYNKRLDLDSNGAVLFREWITQYTLKETRVKGALFKVDFNPKDPINTPRELADIDMALQKLGKAVQIMTGAGLALDSTLGDAQFAYRAGEKIAVHGGSNAEGVANIIDQRNYYSKANQIRGKKIEGSKFLTDKGYPITGGSSFLFGLSYTDNGPEAEAFLSYGQSGDPTSTHYNDQMKLFSKKQWRPMLFHQEEIDKDIKESFILTGPR